MSLPNRLLRQPRICGRIRPLKNSNSVRWHSSVISGLGTQNGSRSLTGFSTDYEPASPFSSSSPPSSRRFSLSSIFSSGHSKWATIKHDKSRNDALRNRQRTVLAHEIMLASKLYGPDAASNPRLANAINAAKKASFPKASIEAAVARGQGVSASGARLEPVVFEGMLTLAQDDEPWDGNASPATSLGIVIDCQSESKLRTLTELRIILKDKGGGVASPSTYLFKRTGKIEVEVKAEGEVPSSPRRRAEVPKSAVSDNFLDSGLPSTQNGDAAFTCLPGNAATQVQKDGRHNAGDACTMSLDGASRQEGKYQPKSPPTTPSCASTPLDGASKLPSCPGASTQPGDIQNVGENLEMRLLDLIVAAGAEDMSYQPLQRRALVWTSVSNLSDVVHKIEKGKEAEEPDEDQDGLSYSSSFSSPTSSSPFRVIKAEVAWEPVADTAVRTEDIGSAARHQIITLLNQLQLRARELGIVGVSMNILPPASVSDLAPSLVSSTHSRLGEQRSGKSTCDADAMWWMEVKSAIEV